VPIFDVTELVGHWGYLAVFVIVVVGNVGVPVPEETALLAAGYLVWRGDLRWSLVLMVGIVSAVAGDNVGYWIGRRYGPGVLERFRRLIGLTPPRFQSMRTFIVRWGPLGVFVARFLPGLRFLAGPLAGAVGLHFSAFMTANVLGALFYVPAVVAAGYLVGYGAGAYVERVLQALGPVAYIVLAVAVILVGSVFAWRAVRAFSDRASP
jgi:membrane-associated protein